MADIENLMERLKKIATPTIANVLDDIGFNGVMNDLSPAGFGDDDGWKSNHCSGDNRAFW